MRRKYSLINYLSNDVLFSSIRLNQTKIFNFENIFDEVHDYNMIHLVQLKAINHIYQVSWKKWTAQPGLERRKCSMVPIKIKSWWLMISRQLQSNVIHILLSFVDFFKYSSYLKIPRNKNNHCCIATAASYPNTWIFL